MNRSRQQLRKGIVPTLIIAVLLASCGQPAAPTTDPERTERYTAYFNEADTDSDGIVNQAEINAVADADFDDLDYNGDGVVTIEDIYNDEQGAPEGAERNMDLSSHLPYDADGDGRITQEEYELHLETELLAEMDGNGDGQVSFAEYRAYEEF